MCHKFYAGVVGGAEPKLQLFQETLADEEAREIV